MAPREAFQRRLAQLMKSEKYSDLKIVCRDQVFNVHRAIACIQSPMMETAINGGFQEATTHTINADEFSIEAVKSMIEFMYTGEYGQGAEDQSQDQSEADGVKNVNDEPSKTEVKAEDSTPLGDESANDKEISHAHSDVVTPTNFSNATAELLIRHVRVNAIGDYFVIPELQQLANSKITNILENNWSADGFADVIRETLDLTRDQNLHKIMSLTATIHMNDLIGRDDFISLDMGNEFATEIIRNMAHKHKECKTELSRWKKACMEQVKGWANECGKHQRVMEGVESAFTDLRSRSSCRNTSCDAEFTCYIEKYDEENGGFRLRCEKCRCKH